MTTQVRAVTARTSVRVILHTIIKIIKQSFPPSRLLSVSSCATAYVSFTSRMWKSLSTQLCKYQCISSTVSIYLSIYLSVYLFVCLSLCRFIYISLSLFLPITISISISISISIPISISEAITIYMYIYIYIYKGYI